MGHYRCSYCGKRRNMNPPESYIRVPPCYGTGCNAKRKRLKKPVKYYHDKYREKNEIGKKPCFPGRGGCDGYPFPHRRGSKFCTHNPNYENVMKEFYEEKPAWNA